MRCRSTRDPSRPSRGLRPGEHSPGRHRSFGSRRRRAEGEIHDVASRRPRIARTAAPPGGVTGRVRRQRSSLARPLLRRPSRRHCRQRHSRPTPERAGGPAAAPEVAATLVSPRLRRSREKAPEARGSDLTLAVSSDRQGLVKAKISGRWSRRLAWEIAKAWASAPGRSCRRSSDHRPCRNGPRLRAAKQS